MSSRNNFICGNDDAEGSQQAATLKLKEQSYTEIIFSFLLYRDIPAHKVC